MTEFRCADICYLSATTIKCNVNNNYDTITKCNKRFIRRHLQYIGIPASLCRHLQSVLNAAARSVAGLRRSDHITETLASLHWLCASERIQFKLAMLIFRSMHGLGPQYLEVADMPSRHRLRSAQTHRLDVGLPRGRLATIGDRTFRAAGSRLWNSLPSDIVDCQTVDTFCFFLVFPFLDVSFVFCV